MNSVYSPSEHVIYNAAFYENYQQAGTWPSDGIEISEEDAIAFSGKNEPPGKMLDYINGSLSWVDRPAKPNSELLKIALASLSSSYQEDIEKLNRAWLAAAVNDGVNETSKKDAVLAQINTRKNQYASDKAAVIAQYPI